MRRLFIIKRAFLSLFRIFFKKNVKKIKKIWFVKINVYLCNPKRNGALLKSQSGGKLGIDSLAQQVEHNTFNVGVLGSSPRRITRKEDD